MKLAALVLAAALNPLVVRSPEPHGNIPANCEVSDAPAMARVQVADAQVVDDPAMPLPPVTPAARPRVTEFDFRPLQNALATNNRPRFDAELARARAANAPTRVYDDVARLWDAQFEAPFFAEGSEPHRIASQYPGYEAAVREQLFTDASGRKFYPAAESKNFVARQTGANVPTTSSRSTTTRSTPAQTTTSRSTSTSTTRRPDASSTSSSTTRRSTQPSRKSPSTPSRTTSATRRSPSPSSSPDPSATRRPAAAAPAPVVPAAGSTSPAGVPPAAGSLPADSAATTPSTTGTLPIDTTTTDPMTTETTATDTVATDTAATDTTTTTAAANTATTATTGTTAAPAEGRRSIVLPAILILIGVAVLILLFKAK